MTQAATPTAGSRTPPRHLMRWGVNPVVRLLLHSPAHHWMGPVVLLELRGRRTGRRLRVPVVGHAHEGELYAITDGRWAANFRGGTALTVVRQGRRRPFAGLLLEEPAVAAGVIRAVVERSGEKALRLTLPPDVSDADLLRLRRVVRLREVGPDVLGRDAGERDVPV
jgi:hypothetical protein